MVSLFQLIRNTAARRDGGWGALRGPRHVVGAATLFLSCSSLSCSSRVPRQGGAECTLTPPGTHPTAHLSAQCGTTPTLPCPINLNHPSPFKLEFNRCNATWAVTSTAGCGWDQRATEGGPTPRLTGRFLHACPSAGPVRAAPRDAAAPVSSGRTCAATAAVLGTAGWIQAVSTATEGLVAARDRAACRIRDSPAPGPASAGSAARGRVSAKASRLVRLHFGATTEARQERSRVTRSKPAAMSTPTPRSRQQRQGRRQPS